MLHLLSRCPPVVMTGGAILLATLLRWVLAPLWGSSFPYITYFPAIMFTTLVAGWKQGVAATLLAGICVPLLFSDPVFGVQQAAAWVFFVIVNLLLVVLCERIQSGQQLAEQAFHTSEARFLNFMTHLPGLAWIKDRAGRYVFVNDAAAHAFGRPREQVYGKTDDELFSPDTAHLFRTNDQKVLVSRSPVETIETLVQEDGLHYSLVNKFPIPIDADGTLFIGGIALDVTRNRQDQEALRQSQERLAGILTTAMDAIISVDSRQIITLFNGAAERMFGCTAAEAIGRPIDQFIPERYREAHRGHVEAFGRTGVTTRRMGRFGTIHGVRVSGEEFPLEASISQLELNGDKLYTVILRDITERQRAEEALRLSEERFRLATAIGKVGVWEWDIVHNVVSWTDSLYRLHGVRPGELPMTVEGFSRLVHPEDRRLVGDAIAASLEQDRPYELEFRAQRPDGEVIWLFTNAVVLRQSGRAIRMIGATADITPSKRMTEQLKLWNDELERRVEERTAELEQSQHRLRSLAMELNLAEQRERKRIASELHDYLAQLLVLGRLKLGQAKQLVSDQQSRELLVQVEEVLKESLAYTRNLVHDLSPPVLFEFGLIAALRWLGDRMQQHELAVAVNTALERLHLPEDLAVVLFQSVRELLMNVVKHAGTGRAEVRLESAGPALRLIVRDEGPGFDSRVRTAAPASLGSNGFGLFSIRERMRAVGGTLDIESSPGQGTTVTLTVPLTQDSLPTVDDRPAPVGSVLPAGSFRSRTADVTVACMRVLLVDDNAMVRQGLRSLIDGFTGMEVIAEAGDGEEAVALADGLKPSVIVMDIHMPKMNGIDATRHIKSRHPETVVIGLSVDAVPDNRAAMTKSGAAALLSKEAAVSQLEGAIRRAVAERDSLSDVGLPPTLPSPGSSQH